MRNEKAVRKWLKNFLSYHQEISVRTPDGLSLSRVRCFTSLSVAQFFEINEPAMDTVQHNPARLYKIQRKTASLLYSINTRKY